MLVADMHCDTLTAFERCYQEKNLNFFDNHFQIDLSKMIKGNYLLQNFAIFTFLKEEKDPVQHVMRNIDLFYRIMDQYSDVIAPAKNYDDIISNSENHKMSGMLTIEEGAVINDDLSYLRNYYRLGVRMIALSWNFDNGITHPNVKLGEDGYTVANTEDGLTEKGKEYVKEMNRLGMIVDVSHMSDACFYDVCELVDGPFVASHSNAREVCPHGRNLTDDMLKKIAQHNGVVGINYYQKFVNKEAPITYVKDLVQHINYIRHIIGVDYIGLGSDFDGMDDHLEMKDASYLPLLEKELYKNGYTKEDIEKIFYKNVLRVYKEVLK